MSLRIATGKVNKEIKNDRLILEGRLMYYENLLNNMDTEIRWIDQRLKELLERRAREVKIREEKIRAIIEDDERKANIYVGMRERIVHEEKRKVEQFKGAPDMITRLKEEIEGLSDKKKRMMVGPLNEELRKLQGELEKMGVF